MADMRLTLYQIDAFASQVFEGNPAAVCPLEQWLSDDTMQHIAAENNLSETAFFVANEGGFHIRWFTPTSEVKLCGHATLASAYVLFNELGYSETAVRFQSKSGVLTVVRDADWLVMDFPAQPPVACDIPEPIKNSFSIEPVACLKAEDYIVVFSSEAEVSAARPKLAKLEELDLRGVAITARGSTYDFVCRFFAPRYGINEDPVTGSAYTQLVPYWSDVLGKRELRARQLSDRGGDVRCVYQSDRVSIAGKAVKFLEATIEI
jgi:predicted PhzF superfamily epimerase YddE/YHI9